jgi:hypothetical protein
MKENFVASYMGATSELAKAHVEKRIRDAAPKGTANKNKYVASVLTGLRVSACSIEYRFNLLLADDDVLPLWGRIEQDMPLLTAASLYRKARHSARRHGLDLREEVARVIKEHDALPHASITVGGKVIRKGVAIARTAVRAKGNGAKSPKKGAAPGRDLWSELRECIAPHLDARLGEVDPMVRQTELVRLEKELTVLFKYYSERWRKLGVEHADAPYAQRRRSLSAACRRLRLDPPKKGKEVTKEFVAKAKSQYKRMHVAVHHPDRGGDSAALQEATEAIHEIEHYYEWQQRRA